MRARIRTCIHPVNNFEIGSSFDCLIPGKLYQFMEGDYVMRSLLHSVLCLCLGLGLVSVASADDGLPINKVLKHPADYQAKVVTIEGRARAVSTLPVHRGTRECGGGN